MKITLYDVPKDVVSFEIPNYVTEIGTKAFYGCQSLKSVTIPEGVTEIADYAFAYCSSLQNVIIPKSVSKIGFCAFSECKSLQSVTIPESVTTIGRRAFDSCHSLQNITIPESVTTIDDGAFNDCSSLQNVIIPERFLSFSEIFRCFEETPFYKAIKIKNHLYDIIEWQNEIIKIDILSAISPDYLKYIHQNIPLYFEYINRPFDKTTLKKITRSTIDKWEKQLPIRFNSYEEKERQLCFICDIVCELLNWNQNDFICEINDLRRSYFI